MLTIFGQVRSFSEEDFLKVIDDGRIDNWWWRRRTPSDGLIIGPVPLPKIFDTLMFEIFKKFPFLTQKQNKGRFSDNWFIIIMNGKLNEIKECFCVASNCNLLLNFTYEISNNKTYKMYINIQLETFIGELFNDTILHTYIKQHSVLNA